MEFTPEQWQGLAAHARERGLIFLSSAFSLAAVELLRGIGMPAWKIGSGEFASRRSLGCDGGGRRADPVQHRLSKRGEIDNAVAMFRGDGPAFRAAPMHEPVSHAARRSRAERDRRVAPGASLVRLDCRITAGAFSRDWRRWRAAPNLVEVHVTFDRRMFGPDTPASLTFDELGLLVPACATRWRQWTATRWTRTPWPRSCG